MVSIKKVAVFGGFPAVTVTESFNKIIKIGFADQKEVNVMECGNILLFTEKETVKHFGMIRRQKLWSTNYKQYAPLTKEWCEKHISDSLFLKVYFTPIGVFVKPCNIKEFNSYVIK